MRGVSARGAGAKGVPVNGTAIEGAAVADATLARRGASAVALLLVAVALGACTGDVTPFEEAIEVRDLGLEDLEIRPPRAARVDPLRMNPGDSVPFTLAGFGSGREIEIPSKERNWRVSDGRYASIDGNGVLTARANGTFTVRVNIGDVSAPEFDVTVFDAAIESLSIERAEREDPIRAELDPCLPTPYVAIGAFNDGSERLLLSDVEWSVTQGSGARVETLPDASAELIGTRPGELTLTAASGGASGETSPTVDGTLRSLEIGSEATGTLSRSVGNSLQLTATGAYGPNADVTRDVVVTDGVEWDVSAGTAFASITNGGADEDSRGLVSANSVGTATIRARCGDVVDTAEFTVFGSGDSGSGGDLNPLSFEDAEGAGDDADDGGTLDITLSEVRADGFVQLRVATGSTYDEDEDVTTEATWRLVRSTVDVGVDDPLAPGFLTTAGQEVGQLDTDGLDRGQFLPLRPGTVEIEVTHRGESATLTVRVLS